MERNAGLIAEIRAQKLREKSADRDALLEFAGVHLYGEKIHYALELIQNAEDEGAKSVTFIFDRDYAVVTNDGRPFNAEDVWGICSVRPGRKKNKIGFFGIGFKSVFKITERPQIISNGYNFAIEQKIYPYPGEPLPGVLADCYCPDKGSVFVLPYSDVVPDPNELIEQFNALDEKLLLFLDSVEHIRFIDRVNETSWEITKQRVGPDTYRIIHPGKATSGTWKVFHRTLPVDVGQVAIPAGKVGIEQTRLTVAFPCDSEIPEATIANVAYCYLPTKKRTDLPFLIQADFLPTVGRENIADDPWNEWLLGQLGIFAADCIEKLRNSELSEVLFDLIPLRREIQDPQMKTLYSQLRSQLTEKRFVQTQRRRFIAPSVAAFPRDERVRRLLDEEALCGVLEEKRSYVRPALDERAKEVLEELDAFPVDEAEVIAFIQKESELKRKNEAWFLDLYDFLASYFGDAKRPYLWNDRQHEHFETFSRCRCILTAQNHVVAPKDPEHLDRMVCYSGIANMAELGDLFMDEELIILHPFFQEASVTGRKGASSDIEEKRERVKEFFDTLEIRRYFRQFHVINQIILPKFRSGKYQTYDTGILYRYLDYIRSNLDAYESEVKKSRPMVSSSAEVFGDIIRSVLVRGFVLKSGRRVEVYRTPRDLYFSRAYGKAEVMEELFKGVKDIAFLSPYYINRGKRDVSKGRKQGLRRKPVVSWRRFFEVLGVWSCPRIVASLSPVSISGKQGYDWVSRQYSPRGEHELAGDHESPDLRGLLDYLSKRRAPQASRRRLALLWTILEKNWSRVYKGGCKCTYRYFYYGWNEVSLSTSSFLEMLRRWKWVPTSDGGFSRPSELHLDTTANRHLLGDDGIYTKLTGNRIFLDDLQVRVEPDPADVVSHLTSLSQQDYGKTNRLSECHTIYTFLRDHPTEAFEVGHLSELFETGSLLYLPRADRSWWSPSTVFWQDFSELFRDKRGYIEQNSKQFYPNGLRDFMLSLGVHERPSTLDCLDFLRDLKANADLGTFKRFAPSLYLHMEHLSKIEDRLNETWSEPLFLSQKEEFLHPAELYVPDDEDYVRLLGDQLDLVWLPFLPASIRNFLHKAGFIGLANHTQVSKIIDGAEELDSGVVQSLMNILTATEAYLRAAHPQDYEALRDARAFEVSRSLSIFQAASIRLVYTARHLRNGQDVRVQTESGVFLSRIDNSLWVTRGVELFSTEVARQLSKLFHGAESQAFSFLDSMMQTRGDPDAVILKLSAHGIDSEVSNEDEQAVEAIEILPGGDVPGQPEPESSEASDQREGRKPERKDAPTPPPDIKVSSWLINPDEYVEDEEEERVPYNKTEVKVQPAIKKRVKLGLGKRSDTRPERRLAFKVILSKLSTEDVALELAMRHEEEQGNLPEDRHKQRRIGYDIYSKIPDGGQKFIEVKGFRDDNGVLNFPRHEWAKAENEQEAYFVYIYTGLRADGSPALCVIRNPTKYLTPDTPEDKRVSDWWNGVAKKITFKKV